eukprot:CAMPEP_0185755674 /NCGR_PEP_ID=MMETSP1174-20130828/14144_1 /TAXON_ID=35687 /ORGANISM="Dictyocha speculum, Strain CCMP1381" /LENGTH=80 /DNA_ID=CAMNT_0028434313 /DNA_START=96 /DNA_END=335 /DNA_ORIENTATION=+
MDSEAEALVTKLQKGAGVVILGRASPKREAKKWRGGGSSLNERAVPLLRASLPTPTTRTATQRKEKSQQQQQQRSSVEGP